MFIFIGLTNILTPCDIETHIKKQYLKILSLELKTITYENNVRISVALIYLFIL